MTVPAPHSYLLPFDFSARRLRNRLAPHVACETDTGGRWEDRFLDSFDWRLHGAGLVMQHRRESGEQRAALFRVGEALPLETVECTAVPAWPRDLPQGAFQAALAEALQVRMLLVPVQVTCRFERLRVLNEDDKTVVRLQVERREARADRRSEARTLLPRVRLLPVKGYRKEAAAVRRLLEDVLEFPPAPPSIFGEALAAVGREAGDYSSRLDIRLRPTMNAEVAARRIFRTLFATLEANIEGTLAAEDTEFLHDLRVATRRTRSALSQVKGVLPPGPLQDFKERFAWLGGVTGPLRDIDVFILKFPRYRDSLPLAMQPAIDPLREFLEMRRLSVRRTLRRHLRSDAFARLRDDWRRRIEPDAEEGQDDPPPEPVDNRERPVVALASERIWKMYRCVLRDGRAIDSDTAAEALHDLRKECKKLRYLMEFFASLYPGEDVRLLLRDLKKLLENLGDFQDLEVQAGELRGFAADMRRRKIGDADTQFAIGALVADLLRRQEAERAAFAAQFAAFDSRRHRKAFRRLFGPSEAVADTA